VLVRTPLQRVRLADSIDYLGIASTILTGTQCFCQAFKSSLTRGVRDTRRQSYAPDSVGDTVDTPVRIARETQLDEFDNPPKFDIG